MASNYPSSLPHDTSTMKTRCREAEPVRVAEPVWVATLRTAAAAPAAPHSLHGLGRRPARLWLLLSKGTWAPCASTQGALGHPAVLPRDHWSGSSHGFGVCSLVCLADVGVRPVCPAPHPVVVRLADADLQLPSPPERQRLVIAEQPPG